MKTSINKTLGIKQDDIKQNKELEMNQSTLLQKSQFPLPQMQLQMPLLQQNNYNYIYQLKLMMEEQNRKFN